MSQANDNPKPEPVRGKYAAAFNKGVRVVVHTRTGDQVRRVKRTPDGRFEWCEETHRKDQSAD